jgi:VCBS repeat-containing protein
MVYDPNGSNNSSLISLVAGTISFVAGQTAKHGDMKIDTPVATMGIRGTAVLVEIDFDVPGQNGTPAAKFQVLMEPDGTTGSYILFDKNTLAPIAVVDKAGQRVDISNNNVSVSDSAFTPELQKLITDVFALKFSNTNPQNVTHFADTLTPQQTWLPIQQTNGGSATAVALFVTPASLTDQSSTSSPPSGSGTGIIPHLPVPPTVVAIGGSLTALPNSAGHSINDTASGQIKFADVNIGDRPTVTTAFASFTVQNALHQDVAATLTAQQLADIKALEIPLIVVPDPANNNNGSATWTYNIPNAALEFLGAGETVTLNYVAEVDSNYPAGSQTSIKTFSVTIVGTNDVPAIATTSVAFTAGHATIDHVVGAIDFTDLNLTDRPAVSAALTSFTLTDASHHALTLTPQLEADIAAAEVPLTLTQTVNSNNGSASWSYSLPDSNFNFLEGGQTLTLIYTATVNDGHGGVVAGPITLAITGTTDAPVIEGESDPPPQVIVPTKSAAPVVLGAGINSNNLGLSTESFDNQAAGSISQNGLGSGNFFSSVLDATFVASGDAGVVKGTSGVSGAPFVGPAPGQEDTTNYLSIGAGGTETVTFATEQNVFGLYWGSVDSFNTISFYNGDQLVASYTGADVSPLFATGNQGSFSSNGYVEFPDLAPFTKVVLATGNSNAFEIDNVSAGFVSHQLSNPISGTLTVSDAVIGDTLTASVVGNAVVTYDGSTTLPVGVDVSELISAASVTFDSVIADGGSDVLHWTYNPSNVDLEFLQPGQTLTVTFEAEIRNGHGTSGDQALTVAFVGVSSPMFAVSEEVQSIQVSEATNISGITLSETDATGDETFTVTLTDSHGVLSAHTVGDGDSAIVSGTTLTITGSLSDVNRDLATLTDINSATGSDPITLTAIDSLGHNTGPQTVAVTVHDRPVLSVADQAQTIHAGEATKIAGISLSATDNTNGEVFTVTLTDSHGVLSAHTVGDGDTAISSGTTLTITGSLSDLNSDLATLIDTNGTAGPDPISVTAIDSLGDGAMPQKVAVTIQPPAVPAVTTLTFDNSLSGEGPIPDGYGGLDWSNFDYLNSSIDSAVSGYAHGTVTGPDVAYNGYGESASISGMTFNFIGADLTGAWNNGLTVTVDGYDHNVLVDEKTVLVNTSTPTWFEFDFDGITDLVFSSSGGVNAGYNGNGTHFALDNLSYSALANPNATIGAGGSVQIGSFSADNVIFSSSSGTLVLDDPLSFTGKIGGISGSGDVLDLKGLDADTTAATGSGSYDTANGTTTLTVISASQHLNIPIILVGDYSNSAWTVSDDGHGGVDIADPPVAASSLAGASGAALEVANGASLNVAKPIVAGENATFQGSTGIHTLDAPASFDGMISGFGGDGILTGSDEIALKGINYQSKTFVESFNAKTDVLSVSDGTNGAKLHFVGNYQAENFKFLSDGEGDTIVYDPPVLDNLDVSVRAGHRFSGHGFVFKFLSDDGSTLHHAITDAFPSGSAMAATTQVGFHDGHDVSREHSAGNLEGHDPIAWAGIINAQLHANGFHFV